MASLGEADGFALLETVFALAILAAVMAAIAGLLTSGMVAVSFSRQRTVAEQVAAGEIEAIRQMDYTSVGTVNGNPGGPLPVSSTISIPGGQGTQTIQVVWMNDPVPTAYRTYADYKRVSVTITRNSDSDVLSQQTTYVGPANANSYGGATNAIANPQVIDMGNNSPLSGVPVALSGGPSAASSATTDGSGKVLFPALTPNPTSGGQQYYILSVTPPSGYTALADDVSPNSPAHVQLTAGQTFSPVLRVYQAATVNVSVAVAGSTYTGAGTLTLTSSRPTLSGTLSSGTAQFTGVVPNVQYTANVTIGGVIFSSSPQTVPTAYPTNLTSSYAFSLPYLVVTVYKKTTTCGLIAGATVTVTGGPQSVNVSQTSASDGTAKFVLPAGGSYTIKVVKSGSTTVTVSPQTIQAAPGTTSVPVSLSGVCP